MLRAIVRQGALRGAVASAAGAFAVGTAAWARCDAPPARVQPPPRGPASAAAAAEAEANGDLTARNLDVNIARVEDWKATIERAKAAWSAGERLQAEVELRAALEKASYFGNESPPVATSMHNLAEVRCECRAPFARPPCLQGACAIRPVRAASSPRHEARAAGVSAGRRSRDAVHPAARPRGVRDPARRSCCVARGAWPNRSRYTSARSRSSRRPPAPRTARRPPACSRSQRSARMVEM